MSGYYDREGKPMDLDAWSAAFGDQEYKRVGYTEVGDVRVSTVWLGMNHNWGDGPPLIFETRVFGGEDDEWMDRYATEDAAVAGHNEVVAAVKNNERLPS